MVLVVVALGGALRLRRRRRRLERLLLALLLLLRRREELRARRAHLRLQRVQLRLERRHVGLLALVGVEPLLGGVEQRLELRAVDQLAVLARAPPARLEDEALDLVAQRAELGRRRVRCDHRRLLGLQRCERRRLEPRAHRRLGRCRRRVERGAPEQRRADGDGGVVQLGPKLELAAREHGADVGGGERLLHHRLHGGHARAWWRPMENERWPPRREPPGGATRRARRRR